jgi:hypothetical protein
MNNRMLVCLCMCVLTLTGCGSKFVCRPMQNGQQTAKGIVYYLPKSLVQVKVTFGIQNDDGIYRLRIVDTDKTPGILVDTINVADPNQAFCIDSERFHSPAVQTGTDLEKEVPKPLTIELSPTGTLNVAKASFEDKAATVIANIGDAAQSAARLAAMAMAAKKSEPDAPPTITITRVFEPSSTPMNFTEPWVQAALTKFARVNGSSDHVNVPDARCGMPQITVSMAMGRPSANLPVKINAKTAEINGLVLRAPVAVDTQVIVNYGFGPEVLFQSDMPIAQAGEICVLPMESSIFTNRSQQVTFTSNGTVQSFQLSSTSAAQTLMAQLKTSTAGLLGFFKDVLPTVDITQENSNVDAELKAAKAERKLLEAKLAQRKGEK